MLKYVSAIAISILVAPYNTVSASVFLGNDVQKTVFQSRTSSLSCRATKLYHAHKSKEENHQQMIARTLRRKVNPSTNGAAMAIPGYGVAEQVFVGGFANFLSVYNIVITARVLLSWFPQAQGIGLLQPVFQITDPYLNLFRGIVPPIFGLDLSPILAFVLLNVLTSATAAVGAEITPNDEKKIKKLLSSQQYNGLRPFPVKPYYNKKTTTATW